MPTWFAKLRRVLRNTSESVGQRGERAAARHLKKTGYRILARNLRNRFGEVDLLAQAPDGRTIVIVEVKAAVIALEERNGSNRRNPLPEEHVNAAKQRKLTALASQLARQHKLQDRPIRFDVVGVDLPPADAPGNPKPTIRHHEAAFEASW